MYITLLLVGGFFDFVVCGFAVCCLVFSVVLDGGLVISFGVFVVYVGLLFGTYYEDCLYCWFCLVWLVAAVLKDWLVLLIRCLLRFGLL